MTPFCECACLGATTQLPYRHNQRGSQMPHLLLKCIAPRPHRPSELCGREFVAYSPHALYCSLTCANRAHRWARVQRAKGLGYTSGAHLLSQSAASEARVKASLSDPLIAAQVSA